MQQKILIGLHGFARSGKDSLGGMLNKNAASQGVILPTYALASPLKDMMCGLLRWDERHRDGDLKEKELEFDLDLSGFVEQWERHQMSEEFNLRVDGDFFDDMLRVLELDKCNVTSPRKVFQLFGTEFVRERIAKDAWLRLAARQLNKGDRNGLIVTDIRYDNEAEWIRDNGGYVIHVLRDGQERPVVRGHVSESGIDERLINYTTRECSDLNELYLESLAIEDMIMQDTFAQGKEVFLTLGQAVRRAL